MVVDDPTRFGARLWRYQQERFPLYAVIPIAVVSGLSSLGVARTLAGLPPVPDAAMTTIVVVTLIGLLLQMRIADEIRNYAVELAHHPGRPLARGLVTRRDLMGLALVVAAAQVALAQIVDARLAMVLAASWCWMIVAPVVTSAVDRLSGRPRPWVQAIIRSSCFGMLAVYATAPIWLPHGGAIAGFGLVAFCLFAVAAALQWEVAQALAGPPGAAPGEPTLKDVWGGLGTGAGWFILVVVASSLAAAVALEMGVLVPVALAVDALIIIAMVLLVRFALDRTPARGRWIAVFASAWVILAPAVVGIGPMIF